ncbi:hypothetical protein [Actinokineospora fastidiosa]|uniref:Uncharacterized protein n=1 Tax=Actinokineospora fastidiosa TaxID=1816 RepID=A0A918GHG0_9PSEU|nr:hypothetical protein [Actinokineospora fastidiosa]GGS36809.1 hypothetical protein GCM10010171_34570 [Actinokineospora fastidiosa]
MAALRPLLTAAVAVVLGAAVIAVVDGPSPSGAAECAIPAYAEGTPAAPSAAPDGGGLRVVEQGFTQSADVVSVGAVVENTSGHAAYRTRVLVRLFDAKRMWLPEERAGEVRRVVEIPVVLPGQRVGVGTDAHPAPLYGGGAAVVASFEVELTTTTWLDGNALGPFRTVTATGVATEHPNPAAPGVVSLRYREDSPNCRALTSRGAAAVYRDATGAIVGGAIEPPGALIVFRDDDGAVVGGEPGPPASPSCAPGDREMWIIPLHAAPPSADHTRTEVHPYCDLSRPAHATGAREPRN